MNGKEVPGSGKATNVFEKKQNTWRLCHEHLSV
ncbi:nuclear transport factor 2 family protein [Rummeliibacillus suwonensis]